MLEFYDFPEAFSPMVKHWFIGVSMEEVSCGLLIKLATEILAILLQ